MHGTRNDSRSLQDGLDSVGVHCATQNEVCFRMYGFVIFGILYLIFLVFSWLQVLERKNETGVKRVL